MYKFFLIVVMLSCVQLHAQEDEPKSAAEKAADSILNEFKSQDENNFEDVSKEEQEKLIAADEKHMNEFLLLERDKSQAKEFKTYLQILIGSVFLLLFFIVIRNGRKKKVSG